MHTEPIVDDRLLRYLISIIYKKDIPSTANGNSELAARCYRIMIKIHFCPGFVDGKMIPNILNKWIDDFKKALELQGQSKLFQHLLGKVFVYSPVGADGIAPHESIRRIIETFGDDDLIEEYSTELYNSRGVHTVTDGKAEKTLSEYYKQISYSFRVKYPKTANVFLKLSEAYGRESKDERRVAEEIIY